MDDYHDDDGLSIQSRCGCTSSPNSAINKFSWWNIKSAFLPPPHISAELLWIHISFLFHCWSEIPLFLLFLECKNVHKKCRNAEMFFKKVRPHNAACVVGDQWVALSRTKGFTIKIFQALQYLLQSYIWIKISVGSEKKPFHFWLTRFPNMFLALVKGKNWLGDFLIGTFSWSQEMKIIS